MSVILTYVSLVGLLRLLNSILSKLLVVRFIRFLLQFSVFTDKMLHITGKIESLRGVVVFVVRWCHCFHVFLHLFFCCVSVSLQHEKARFLIRFLTWFLCKLPASTHRLLRFRLLLFFGMALSYCYHFSFHYYTFEVRILLRYYSSLSFSLLLRALTVLCGKKSLLRLAESSKSAGFASVVVKTQGKRKPIEIKLTNVAWGWAGEGFWEGAWLLFSFH